MHSLAGLKTVRTLLNFQSSALANRIGVEIPTYYRYERGERRIYLDKAIALAQLMDVPLDMLTREITEAERIDLFARGERKRRLLELADGDESLAATLEGWSDDDGDA